MRDEPSGSSATDVVSSLLVTSKFKLRERLLAGF
jgi:hypothetical protein